MLVLGDSWQRGSRAALGGWLGIMRSRESLRFRLGLLVLLGWVSSSGKQPCVFDDRHKLAERISIYKGLTRSTSALEIQVRILNSDLGHTQLRISHPSLLQARHLFLAGSSPRRSSQRHGPGALGVFGWGAQSPCQAQRRVGGGAVRAMSERSSAAPGCPTSRASCQSSGRHRGGTSSSRGSSG
jgi:hypothetical protein